MILQALTRHYEDLLRLGQIPRPGWSKAKVSYALDLGPDGQLLGLFHLQASVLRGKKTVLVPQELELPSQVKRSVGVAANFLCDHSGYLLGADAKGNPQRTADCFAAAKQLHLDLLGAVESPAARAVVSFFRRWDPACAAAHPCLQQDWDELMKGGNLTFWYAGRPAAEDALIRGAWQDHYGQSGAQQETALCLVTGKRACAARLHPSIKGVAGAQSVGASLVSFNAPSFCSFEHEQGANAPVGEYAAFAYGSALNHLLADRQHVCRAGDTTIVCWAEGGEPAYQDCLMSAMLSDSATEQDILGALHRLVNSEPITWNDTLLSPDTQFYILGLAPNAARLSVRFFWQNTFGALAKNVERHYRDLEIMRPSFDPYPTLPLWRLLRETVNLKARTPEPSPRLAGDLMQAVLTGSPYPATLLHGVMLRIRAEREVSRGRAAVVKAYYLRNSNNQSLKEVMTVQLNEHSSYLPYVLGRLFSVLEEVQQQANPSINTTIKDRYFNSASATPALVFPQLLNLAQKHLAKLGAGKAIHYNKQITELTSLICETLPARLSLPEQGAFQIGYYHQTQKRFAKKEEQYHV